MSPRSPPIFLWKETHPVWGFLSQWYESPFHTGDKSIVYRTAEQYMMHQKALLFCDSSTASKIMKSTSPAETQALGRTVKNYNSQTWTQNRERIVTDGSYFKYKFSLLEGVDIKQKFLDTGNREFVEASPVDRIWGVGFGEEEAEVKRAEWGLNLLGKCLERAREKIRKEEEKEGK